MQTGNIRKPLFIVLPFLLVVLISSALPAFAQVQKKVAILPFEVLAAKDFAYLQEGVRIMLASRLAAGAGVTVVDRAAVDQALAGNGKALAPEKIKELGKKLGADYLVTGNLTAMGGVSLDAKVHSVADGGVQNFFATAAKEGEVINAVDQLAWDVAAKVFGVTPPAGQGQAVATAPIPMQSPYQTAHPDRGFMYQSNGGGSAPIIRPDGIGGRSGFVKTRNFNMNLRAMDIGDVDGDGHNEIILAEAHKVTVYRRDDNRFTAVGGFSTLNRNKIHAVSVVDLNNNGKAEIYVSAADTTTPSSLAVEWDGKSFAPIFEDARWYVRALEMPGQGMILAGQQCAVDGPLRPGIYRLEVKGNAVEQQEQLAVPNSVNLFDFSVADLDGDGLAEVIAVDQYDRLTVMRQGGSLLYKSDEYYGGTTRFVGGQEALGMVDSARKEDLGRVYVPSRIIIADVNLDGHPDVILNKNLSTASRVLKNAKSYPSGEIHALTWNGIGLTELWRTRKIEGYISDYQMLASADGSGAALYVGLVLNSGALDAFAEGQSTVLRYQLKFEAEVAEKNDTQVKDW